MKEIPLTKGRVAFVDDKDYLKVMMHKWCATKRGNSWYALTEVEQKTLWLHRFILNAKSGEECDHINGDGLDNRHSNLRICTHQQNGCNRRKSPDTSSRYKGVSKKRNRWRARIRINYRLIYLGMFDSEEEAAKAYDAKAIELHGIYAKINFI